MRAGSAVCLTIHIPIHIPIHSPAGPRSPQHPRSELRSGAGKAPLPAGAGGSPGSLSPRRRPGAVPQPGSVLLFSDGDFPHFEPRQRARVPGRQTGVPCLAKVKMTRRYGCISFWLLSVLPLVLSWHCFQYVRAHLRALPQSSEIPIFTYL